MLAWHPAALSVASGVLLSLASIVTCMRIVTRLPARTPTLYLTFDDGPDPCETPRLLEVLDRHGVQATFFVLGETAKTHPALTEAIVRAGHLLGNHSATHARFNRISIRRQFHEIATTDRILERFDGKAVHPFRPPHGKLTLGQLMIGLLRWQRIALWTHDSLDYRMPVSDVVARLRAANVRSGDILLFHGDGPVAGAALEQLLPQWKGAGFGFAAVP